MAEIDPIEEKALPYVLDELSETEAREFERRMEGSAELAERVRELEEGAAAVALACPPKRLPKQIWNNIERHIQTERRLGGGCGVFGRMVPICAFHSATALNRTGS
jgi:anti-sigma-K factor RskA